MPDSGRFSARDYPGPLTAAERRQIDAQRAAQEIIGGDPLAPYDLAGVAREVLSLRAENERLRTMLKRLLDVALVDGYGETVRDEAEALLKGRHHAG